LEMVLCDLYHKRFDLTQGLLCDIPQLLFVTNCVVVIIQYGVRIIFTINELVDRTRNFISNASQFKNFF